MMIGPGTIATIIICAGQAGGFGELLDIGLVVAVVLAPLMALLWFSPLFGRVMSNTMRTVMTRLMGMILLASAVEMIASGLKAVLPGQGSSRAGQDAVRPPPGAVHESPSAFSAPTTPASFCIRA